MIYSAGTISFSGNTVTGSGTNFTSPSSQIRIGQTLLVASNPVQLVQITSINSATSLAVTPAASPVVSGQTYGIFITDSLSVDGLAQSISQLINQYDENISAWETFVTTTANQNITVTINGQVISIPALGKLVNKDDQRLDTVDGKSGGVITGKVTVSSGGADITGKLTVSSGGAEIAGGTKIKNGNVDLASDSVLNSAGGANFDLAKPFVFKGKTQGAQPNNITLVSGDGNTPATGYVGAFRFDWYSDFWFTGITRAGGTTTQSYAIYFGNASGSNRTWNFNTDGSATSQGAWISGSDERHKFKIEKVKNPLAAVISFRGVVYDIKDSGRGVGLIAQDVEKWCPDAVKTYGNRTFSDGTVIKDFKYLDTSGVAAAYHTEAIKALFGLIELALDDPNECRKKISAIRDLVSLDTGS